MQKWRQLLMVKISYSCITSLYRILIFTDSGIYIRDKQNSKYQKTTVLLSSCCKNEQDFYFYD
jgi:hypothetical protein